MTDSPSPPPHLLDFIVDRVNVGIFAVDKSMRLMLWNRFMEDHSRIKSGQVLGRNLFECFPELPRNWLERKINSVFLLRNFAFTSWEQRPYLFRFGHDRPITGGVDFMQQNCTFMPVKNREGEVEFVCVTLFDVTDTGIYQRKLQQAMKSLEESANRDGLTGIYNRRHFEANLDIEFARFKRYGGALSLIIFDLDHFKKINDTYGHQAGDAVLCEVTRRIGSLLRASDIFGRYGGEEFAVLLPMTPADGAAVAAEKLRTAIAGKPVTFQEKDLPVTLSAGFTQALPETRHYEVLIREADSALYLAKKQGRNCAVCCTSAGGESGT